MFDLQTKTALVTGASQGLGAGIARALAAAGAKVGLTHLLNAADRTKAEVMVGEILAQGGTAIALPLDVTDTASIQACIQATLDRFSRLDILINNAGVMQQSAGMATSPEDFDRCHAVNLKGVWAMAQACLPHLKACREGRIVNISSGAGRRGSPDLPAYCASKAAIISLTQSLAAALASDNITVNCVCPGIIWTPMCKSFAELVGKTGNQSPTDEQAFLKQIRKFIPLGRPQTPEDIGHAVAFFASRQAGNITGQALNVDGGVMMN